MMTDEQELNDQERINQARIDQARKKDHPRQIPKRIPRLDDCQRQLDGYPITYGKIKDSRRLHRAIMEKHENLG
jgi:hypothetical protein